MCGICYRKRWKEGCVSTSIINQIKHHLAPWPHCVAHFYANSLTQQHYNYYEQTHEEFKMKKVQKSKNMIGIT